MASHLQSGRFADDPEVVRSDHPEVHKPFYTSETTPTYPAPNGTEKTPQPVHQERTIGGLRRTTFFLAFALAAVIVLAAAIGGGVGSSVCHSNSNKSIATASPPPSTATVTVTAAITPTASSSTSAPSSTPSDSYSASPCPAQNNTVYSSLFNSGANGTPGSNAALDFIVYCNTNFASGLGPHLAQVFTYTMTDCIEACASYNFWNDDATCEQVAWKIDGTRPGNCWIGTRNASEDLTFEPSPLEIAFLQ